MKKLGIILAVIAAVVAGKMSYDEVRLSACKKGMWAAIILLLGPPPSKEVESTVDADFTELCEEVLSR